jgi:HSP20 family molecular chaperone IbpA
MSSFLDRLKKKDVVQTTSDDKKQEQIAAQNKPAETGPPAEQLKVDIFQTHGAILIYSQIAGTTIHDFSVTIEGDGDIVVIKGQRTRPNGDSFPSATDGKDEREHLLEECSWGKFYRQIILPAEVDATKTEAKMREGVLMLRLPLKEAHEKGVRIEVQQVQ